MALTYGFLDGSYTAAQFAGAHFAAFGNGVCDYGERFAVTARGSNGVSVAMGYALVGGYWIKNTASVSIYISYGETAGGRYDAIVLRADLENRTADIALEQGTASAEPSKYTPVRNDKYYELILAYVYVAPATTMIADSNIIDTREDVDLCGMIEQSVTLAKKILEVYHFTLSEFSDKMAGLTDDAQAILGEISNDIQSWENQYNNESMAEMLSALESILSNVSSLQLAWDKVGELDESLNDVNAVAYRVGDVLTAATHPDPAVRWLLCDGSSVPTAYPTLSTLLNGSLPSITPLDSRLSAWIYSGVPAA